MALTLQLDIVSPERSLFGAAVAMVEVPGAEGDFGVLPGHMPLISTIRPGVLTIHTDTDKARYFIGSGYAEVTNEGCTILSEYVRDLAQADRSEVEEHLAEARRVLAHAEDDIERARAEQLVTITEALFESLLLMPLMK